MGRGRTTTGMIIASLVHLQQRSASAGADLPRLTPASTVICLHIGNKDFQMAVSSLCYNVSV